MAVDAMFPSSVVSLDAVRSKAQLAVVRLRRFIDELRRDLESPIKVWWIRDTGARRLRIRRAARVRKARRGWR